MRTRPAPCRWMSPEGLWRHTLARRLRAQRRLPGQRARPALADWPQSASERDRPSREGSADPLAGAATAAKRERKACSKENHSKKNCRSLEQQVDLAAAAA